MNVTVELVVVYEALRSEKKCFKVSSQVDLLYTESRFDEEYHDKSPARYVKDVQNKAFSMISQNK